MIETGMAEQIRNFKIGDDSESFLKIKDSDH